MTTVPQSSIEERIPPNSMWVQICGYVESFFPIVSAAACGTLVWLANFDPNAIYLGLEQTLDSAVDATAVLAGFQIAALSILLAIADAPLVQRLQQHGFHGRLVRFHAEAIAWLVLGVIASMAVLFAMGALSDFAPFAQLAASILAGTAVACITSTSRVTYLMTRLLIKLRDS